MKMSTQSGAEDLRTILRWRQDARHEQLGLDPVTQVYDEHAREYEEEMQTPEMKAEDIVFYRHFVQTLQDSPGIVLDMGCGTGMLLDHLPLLAGEYLGVDSSIGRRRGSTPSTSSSGAT